MERNDWNILQTNCTNYSVGKKCGSGSLPDFVNNIKEVYDRMTEVEKSSWRGSSRWGNETFDNAESILRENNKL